MRLTTLLRQKPMEFPDQMVVGGVGADALILRRYRDGDETRITLRPDFQHALDAAGGELPSGPRWTLALWAQDLPLAIGGLEVLEPGVLGAWAICADLHPRAWAFARRCARRVLDYAERDLGARRVHAMARDTKGAIGLLKQLGFAPTVPPWEGPDECLYHPMVRRF